LTSIWDPRPGLVRGTAGNDALTSRLDGATVNGFGGNDILVGFGGRDTLNGGPGRDQLRGGGNADSLSGSTGRDTLRGGFGNDRLFGDDDNDRLYGDSGRDTLNGGAGNDNLQGGTGNDVMRGDSGSDVLNDGTGNDILFGGAASDRFVFGPGHGAARIKDFEDNLDKIDLRAFSFSSVAEAKSFAANVSGDVFFTFAGGEQLIIEGIDKAHLTGADILV
jgi:Ca2+-binding RTX toxin-like protein